ncbi:MAG TPA: SDR family oxidoreductase [Gemmatimonadaceae bacterium]
MKILVTGGTGFIGAAVVRLLLEDGLPVRCLVRKESDLSNLDGLDVEYAHGDVIDMDSVRRALDGCDRVIHLAAIYAIWMKDPNRMYRVNVNGTHKVLTACREAGVQKVVYVSSIAALGAHGKVPANEDAEFNMASVGDHYFISKFQSEQLALDFAAKGLPVTIVNPSVPLGPRDIKPTPSGAIIINVLKGKLPGYIDGGLNLIDVGDCARGIVNALSRGAVGRKYVLGNRNVSMKEFFDLIVKVAGSGKSPRIKFPVFMAVQSGYAEELVARFTGKPPVNTAAWVRVGSHYSWWDSSRAVRELGLPQTPVEKSIAQAIEWFRGKAYL